jgi:hypothetical protein
VTTTVPGPEKPASHPTPLTVVEILRREGRPVPHAAGGRTVPRRPARPLIEPPAEPGVSRRALAVTGSLLMVGAVFGTSALDEVLLLGPGGTTTEAEAAAPAIPAQRAGGNRIVGLSVATAPVWPWPGATAGGPATGTDGTVAGSGRTPGGVPDGAGAGAPIVVPGAGSDGAGLPGAGLPSGGPSGAAGGELPGDGTGSGGTGGGGIVGDVGGIVGGVTGGGQGGVTTPAPVLDVPAVPLPGGGGTSSGAVTPPAVSVGGGGVATAPAQVDLPRATTPKVGAGPVSVGSATVAAPAAKVGDAAVSPAGATLPSAAVSPATADLPPVSVAGVTADLPPVSSPPVQVPATSLIPSARTVTNVGSTATGVLDGVLSGR